MVERLLIAYGITHGPVLRAMLAVPGEVFAPDVGALTFYSQGARAYITALTAQALAIDPGDRVLEVGTGSGFGAAVLSCLAAEVHTMDIDPERTERARARLAALGTSVALRCGDGLLGWPEAAPFNGICVAGRIASIPRPLVEQLAVGGRLVVPIGATKWGQELIRVVRLTEFRYACESLGPINPVPGFQQEGASG
jgi:protein-L-isoaspartate(D-aspartate) O-methyltransferase